MPELPEVETTLRGILPHVAKTVIQQVIVRRTDLRQPISPDIACITGKKIITVSRRSKYLLFLLGDHSHILMHLGMSGSLRITAADEVWKKHDHVALEFIRNKQLRFHDPRRFGLILYLPAGELAEHPLLKNLGPEPLEETFSATNLAKKCATRASAIKLVIMDSKVVVGVGNIYASEALFRAGILPQTCARSLHLSDFTNLVNSIREVLLASIQQGGTTLRDFVHSHGEPGYFKQMLYVYGRKGEPCRKCTTPISHAVLGQRATYWCSSCQK